MDWRFGESTASRGPWRRGRSFQETRRYFADPAAGLSYHPGKREWYDPAKQGDWELALADSGRLVVRQVDGTAPPPPTDQTSAFAAEAHLRDYFVQHLDLLEPGLKLYIDDETTGVEFRTPVGIIDILAIDANEGLVVVELKVSKGPDSVCVS